MRIHPSILFCLATLAGCIGDEPESVYEADGAVEEDITPDMVEVEMPDLPAPVEIERAGLHRITATAFNLDIFRHGCYHGTELDWACSRHDDGRDAHFTHKRAVGSNDTEVADNGGTYWGECVSLVKAATKNNTTTSHWQPGAGVFSGLPSGTAIATFPGGHYSGHTAILLGYVKQNGQTIGIRVADQNWLGRTVKRHLIRKGGSGVSNANNYRAILVP